MRRARKEAASTERIDPDEKSDSTIVFVDESESAPLAECDPFSHLPDEVRSLLEACLIPRKTPGGTLLLKQGEPAGSLLVVEAGTVIVNRRDDEGMDRYLGRVGPGGILGEMALLTDGDRQATATAETDVAMYVLPAGDFHRLAARFPEIAVVLTRFLANRIGSPEGDVLCGQEFSGYRILDRLGRGGMSVVYRAVHGDTGTIVAAKMMSHRLAYDETACRQFDRETDVIATFDHPNVTRLLDRFEAFRTVFSVMPFHDGITLGELLDNRGPLPEELTRHIVGQIVRGLSYAHNQGVVHRDVKPANVLLETDGTIKLLDFGLAQPVDDPEFDGLIVGTPRYMAPEQLAGQLVSPAADYFSLGCLCCELLTGEPLLEQMGVLSLLRSRKKWPLPRLDNLPQDLSSEFRTLLERWLSKNPADRGFRVSQVAGWAEPIAREEFGEPDA